jgi:hypothetical protein
VLSRIFQNQLKAARKAISTLHEDLQWELMREADRMAAALSEDANTNGHL